MQSPTDHVWVRGRVVQRSTWSSCERHLGARKLQRAAVRVNSVIAFFSFQLLAAKAFAQKLRSRLEVAEEL